MIRSSQEALGPWRAVPLQQRYESSCSEPCVRLARGPKELLVHGLFQRSFQIGGLGPARSKNCCARSSERPEGMPRGRAGAT
eukprot:14901910-Alexandrium_andersonii.AAC.1